MIDPSKYLRKAYYDSFNGIVTVYDALAKSNATPPYGVINSIDFNKGPLVKDRTEWTATVTLTLFAEYRENGGTLVLDNICQTLLNLLVPENCNYITVENFSHVICKVISIFNGADTNSAGLVFTKTLRIEHLLKQ